MAKPIVKRGSNASVKDGEFRVKSITARRAPNSPDAIEDDDDFEFGYSAQAFLPTVPKSADDPCT